MRRLTLGVVTLFVLWSAGCGVRTSRVHGTVTYQGKPLANASIIFLSNGRAYPVRISSDGSYSLPSLPHGHIDVAVQVEEPRTPPRPPPDLTRPQDNKAIAEMAADDAGKQKGRGAQSPAGPTLEFPGKYTEPTTSGLSFELDSDDKEYSVDLR
jgi:hypothetical protein